MPKVKSKPCKKFNDLMKSYAGTILFILAFTFLLASGSSVGSIEEDSEELQAFGDFPDNKRPSWSNFRGSWGKRGNWQKLQGMWGKRIPEEVSSDGYETLFLQDPRQIVGQTPDGIVYYVDTLPVKRNEQKFGPPWGKRDDNTKLVSPRSTNWSSLRGSWGKRAGNWNHFRGSWGKRSVHNMDDTSKAQ